MKKSFIKSSLWLILPLLIIGCASAPEQKPAEKPDWVISPPADTAESVYFVSAGSDSGGNEAVAREQAGTNLVSAITNFLGVRVTSETSIEAKATLETFESNISQSIKESSFAQLADFKVVETFSERNGEEIIVFILGEYNKAALLEEQKRLKDLFIEKQEAVSGPEAAGNEALAAGDFYRAAVEYLNAAAAAASSDIDNAGVKFERNINNARNALSNINLFRLNNNIQGFVESPLDSGFELRITSGNSADAEGLGGIPVRASYKSLNSRGRMVIAREDLISDEAGNVVFIRPVPHFVGDEKITMTINLKDAMEPLEDVSNELYSHVEGLEQLIMSRKVVFDYKIISIAKEVSTGIVIIDVDNNGAPTGKTETASGLFEVLSGEGFDTGQIGNAVNINGLDNDAVLNAVREAYGSRFRRVIFGVVGISDFTDGDDRYTVKVSGNILAADLETGRILYSSGNKFKSAMGSNFNSAMSAAFKQFGKVIGEDLANSLP